MNFTRAFLAKQEWLKPNWSGMKGRMRGDKVKREINVNHGDSYGKHIQPVTDDI